MKEELDKYYTPVEQATRCFAKALEVIGSENINYIIEPSYGTGAFCHYDVKPDLRIDIEPEIPEDKGISEVMYRQGSINTKI